MTAPAQDWAEKAEAIVTEWWSDPSPDDNPDPVFDGQRAAIVDRIKTALSDAARMGREEGMVEAAISMKETGASWFQMGREEGLEEAEDALVHTACIRVIRALRGKERS